MLKCKLVLPFILIVVLSNTITGQNEVYKAERVQLSYGLSQTLHHNSPLDLFFQCIEGCTAESQSSKKMSRIDLIYYKPLFKRVEIKTGVGINQVGYDQVVINFLGGETEESNTFTFMNFSIGHSYTYLENGKWNLFVENDLFMDITLWELRKTHYGSDLNKAEKLNLINFSYQFSTGALLNITDKTGLVLAINFKTALSRYDAYNVIKYKPYSLGLNFGISKKL